jgi:hypothetical protein
MATIIAASASYADVLSAYDSSSDGDIISIPAGSATWDSTLAVSKAVSLIGAGRTSTIITNTRTSSSGTNATIALTLSANGRQVISALGFDCNGTSCAVNIIGGSTVWREFWISACNFTNSGDRAVYSNALAAGLVSQCEFLNCSKTVDAYASGAENISFATALTLGTINAIVIEDCTMTITGGAWLSSSGNAITSAGQGGRRTFRYNTIISNMPGAGLAPAIDMHGNQQDVTGQGAITSDPPGGTSTHHGTRQTELYNNIVIQPVTNENLNFLDWRGGVLICFGNKISSPSGDKWIKVREESGDGEGANPSPYAFHGPIYPGQDPQYGFIWDNESSNTSDGSGPFVTFPSAAFPSTSPFPAGAGGWQTSYTSDYVFLVANDNIFLSAPTSEQLFGQTYIPLAYPHPWRGQFPVLTRMGRFPRFKVYHAS